ncbi:class I SAM-dependent methyltransferase [Phycicoccus sp. BSK3Z-2]|uniref:Class I SAM-dependent methyltransferase n=1 Tax=Phycicoccus avicenniae TaxID=2828860 RepID=A0A941HYT2_9MICO|nr:class I SAM-dependent methyltransferase [Phycicoccus avicenniae]MBR7742190.1 class I SAM-dependent methyltransferase [Phycicoccus avicenniae]
MTEHAARRPAGPDETRSANRAWWDGEAEAYHAEHGAFLGDDGFVWGPEGWTEDELGLLDLSPGMTVLEIGAGGAQCSRSLLSRGDVRVVASDLSGGMLRTAARIDAGREGPPVPLLQCDGTRLPLVDDSVDRVFTAYGVVPFVADSATVLAEAARVLRPGGRFVFSTSHPVRWAFPDVPGEAGLTATTSYFDRTPYVESTSGVVTYAEHHRTLGDLVRQVVAAGLALVDLVEPEWPERNREEWGGWSPLRGRLLPGTAILVTERPVP